MLQAKCQVEFLISQLNELIEFTLCSQHLYRNLYRMLIYVVIYYIIICNIFIFIYNCIYIYITISYLFCTSTYIAYTYIETLKRKLQLKNVDI